MAQGKENLNLNELPQGGPTTGNNSTTGDLDQIQELEVKVTAVLGRSRISIRDLLSLGPDSVVELHRRVGEPIDIFVNDRCVARGEVVVLDDRLGVSMTELYKMQE